MARGRSREAIRRAFDLGYSARAEGLARSANPYSFTAWGLGGPWLVGWMARDREEGGLEPLKVTKDRRTTTPTQRDVLLDLVTLGAWVDLSAPPFNFGPGVKCYPVRTDTTRVRELHVRTWTELLGKGFVAMDGRKGRITALGRAAIPEVRAVLHLLHDPRRATLFTRYVSASVLRNLLGWEWVEFAGGRWSVTGRGRAAAVPEPPPEKT